MEVYVRKTFGYDSLYTLNGESIRFSEVPEIVRNVFYKTLKKYVEVRLKLEINEKEEKEEKTEKEQEKPFDPLEDIYNSPEINGYTFRISSEGNKYFKLNGSRIAKMRIPVDVLKLLTKNAPELSKLDIARRKPGDGTGFQYTLQYNHTTYYYNGHIIARKDVPPEELNNIQDRDKYFRKKFEREEEKRRQENSFAASMPKITPKQLLDKENIFTRKDWKRWMLKNHPDRNPLSDIHLVAMINSAVELIYPDIE